MVRLPGLLQAEREWFISLWWRKSNHQGEILENGSHIFSKNWWPWESLDTHETQSANLATSFLFLTLKCLAEPSGMQYFTCRVYEVSLACSSSLYEHFLNLATFSRWPRGLWTFPRSFRSQLIHPFSNNSCIFPRYVSLSPRFKNRQKVLHSLCFVFITSGTLIQS